MSEAFFLDFEGKKRGGGREKGGGYLLWRRKMSGRISAERLSLLLGWGRRGRGR